MEFRTIVRETGLREHVCKHGIGHPDKRSAYIIAGIQVHNAGVRMEERPDEFSDGADVIRGKIIFEELIDGLMTHGCDGCCKGQEWNK